jgi:hypothetical protein
MKEILNQYYFSSPLGPKTIFVLGFKLRISCLLGSCSTTWVMPPAHFALVTFEIGSHIYAQTSSYHHSPICTKYFNTIKTK